MAQEGLSAARHAHYLPTPPPWVAPLPTFEDIERSILAVYARETRLGRLLAWFALPDFFQFNANRNTCKAFAGHVIIFP